MATLKGILRECVENPEDDAPRLVLADWLDDHGDGDRAAFVRGQLALASLDADDPARRALDARLAQFQFKHLGAWVASLHGQVSSFWFTRGLLHVPLYVHNLSSLDTDAEGWDWVERVTLGGIWTPKALVRLGESPLATRLVSLDAGEGGLKLAGTRVLADSPWLANLRVLSLARNNIGNRGAAVLAGSAFVSNLRSLDLTYDRIGLEGVGALGSSPHLAELRSLSLDYNSVGTAGLAALLTSPHLRRLESLSLTSNGPITPRKPDTPLADRPASLTRLRFNGNALGNRGTAALVASPLLAKLTSLDLSGNRIQPAGMRALASSPHLANLTFLNLSYNAPGDEGVRALVRSPYLTNLTQLHLFQWDQDNFTAAGARELAGWPGLARLTRLVVNLDDEGAIALASSPHVAGLRDLCLVNSRLGDVGAAALASSVHLSGLARLDLRANGIGEAGALAIAESETLGGLRCLLMMDRVGRLGVAALRRRFHDRVEF